MAKFNKTTTYELALCALFAALSAVLSQISIAIGPVPITMTHISVFLAAGLLGAWYGALSQVVFVLLGAAGLPVFAGLKGGIGAIMGPTGGFIIAYIPAAFIVGLVIKRFGKSIFPLAAAMLAGCITIYIPGIIWFAIITGTPVQSALMVCVLPFIPGDILKSAICVGVLLKSKHFIKNIY